MSWYRTGTVAVTNGSKTVTGVGTLFTTAVNAGDAFALVDANLNPTGAWYEVESVTNNTTLVLKQSYAGSTGSNKQYCVFNLVGNMTTPSFAQRLATFFASFQSLIDKPTATPTALGIPVADENGNIADGWISTALLKSNDAMVFKGTLGTGGTVMALPTSDYVRGWTYKVITAGTYAGLTCAIGDLIVAISSFDTEFQNSDWVLVPVSDEMTLKADIAYVDAGLALKADAADVMNAPESSVDENIPIFDGVTGDKLKDSGVKLSDKADVTALETEKKLLMDEIDALKKASIENSNAPYLTVSDYGDVTLAKNSVGVGTIGVDGVTLTEKLSFFTLYSNVRCTSVYSNGTLISSATGADFFGPNKDYYFIALHKYYFRVKARVLQSGFTKLFTRFMGGRFDIETIPPAINQWYTFSSIKSLESSAVGNNFVYGYATDYTGKQLEVAEMIIFDLTEAGLESLTAEQLDQLSPEYFDGKKTFGGVGCIKAVGKNIFDGKLEPGSIHGVTGVPIDYAAIVRTKNYTKVLPSTTYKVSAIRASDVEVELYLFWYDINKAFISRVYINNFITYAFTAPANAHYLKIAFLNTATSAWYEKYTNVQIERGSIATPYAPYVESRLYFETDPMYSNDTAKDVLTYSGGKYYHTHNVDSDGVAIETPYDTEVDTNGQIICLSEGTVTYEPWYPDIGIYTNKFTLTKVITAVKELYKYGSETPITDAVIAEDGLSFTSASLTAGDLAYGVFEFDEPLRPLMTIKSRNDVTTSVDTSTGTVYTFRPVVTDGVITSWELTEV